MQKILIPAIIALLCSASLPVVGPVASGSIQKRVQPVTGTYTLRRGNGAGGQLEVFQLPNNDIKFEIECNRGAPSYNSGGLGVTVALAEKRASYLTTR
jgi:hypothetical protein